MVLHYTQAMQIQKAGAQLKFRRTDLGQVTARVSVSEYQPDRVDIDLEPALQKGFLKELASHSGESLADIRGLVQTQVRKKRRFAVASALTGTAAFGAAAATLMFPQVPGSALLGLSVLGIAGMVQAERFNQQAEQMATLDLITDNAHRPHITGSKLGYHQEPTHDYAQLRGEYV